VTDTAAQPNPLTAEREIPTTDPHPTLHDIRTEVPPLPDHTGYVRPESAPIEIAPERPKLTRAQVLAIREAERNQGVDFELFKTGITAKVRDLPFTDKTLLSGIPVSLRAGINAAIAENSAKNGATGGSFTIEQAIKAADSDEQIANALCVAGFIWPRIVADESELDGSDDCWLVTDLHIEERRAYMTQVMRTDRGDVARMATFPGSRVAGA
jgi:hypothetical protein